MTDYLALVDEFHRAFQYKQPTPDKPCVTDSETNLLRIELIREELKELTDALNERNAVETLDALCDLQYVLSGAILAHGFSKVFDAAFREVHRSNLSKIWDASDMECYLYENPSGAKLSFSQSDTDGYIARRADGKIAKSPSYSPAQLAQFVEYNDQDQERSVSGA